MKTIKIDASTEYKVFMQGSLLKSIGQVMRAELCGGAACKAVIITDSNVDRIYSETVASALRDADYEVVKYVFPEGETSKTMDTLARILSFMVQNHISRGDVLLALGGGVVGDIAGFAAATYMRGIKYVQIPTTILAAVDSSVGGKTAIDLPEGKNLVGAFYQPAAVICDIDTFSTLPEREWRNGLAEIIKYGVIREAKLLDGLEELARSIKLQAIDKRIIADLIESCIKIKTEIVRADEFEKGERKVLNFGHSVGHAVEKLSNYDIPHGQAVACGMLAISDMAAKQEICGRACVEAIARALKICGISTSIPYSAEEIAEAMRGDKKASNGFIDLILPARLGEVIIRTTPLEELEDLLKLCGNIKGEAGSGPERVGIKNESTFKGEKLSLKIYGASHTEKIGMVLQGIAVGERIDAEELQRFLSRRAPGNDELSTSRREPDIPKFVSGIKQASEGNLGDFVSSDLEIGRAGAFGDVEADDMVAGMLMTTGEPIEAIIYNEDAKSQDYYSGMNETKIKVPRPGHSDFTSWIKYGEIEAGGGKWSGRMTAAMCIAGGIAKQLLGKRGIEVDAAIRSVGSIRAVGTMEEHRASSSSPLSEEMRAFIAEVKECGDSVGGVIECEISGMPAGCGDALFDGLEAKISQMIFAIPAVKGIEFGTGFQSAVLRGSENNDRFGIDSHTGDIISLTNNCGGILGGISTGMPINFKVAIKPTPSIALEQQSVNLETREEAKIKIEGRHDPCIVPRALPCVEAAAAIAILDSLYQENSF